MCSGNRFHCDGAATANERAQNFLAVLGMRSPRVPWFNSHPSGYIDPHFDAILICFELPPLLPPRRFLSLTSPCWRCSSSLHADDLDPSWTPEPPSATPVEVYAGDPFVSHVQANRVFFHWVWHDDDPLLINSQSPSQHCNMMRWVWWDWELSRWLTTLLQCFDNVGWVIRPVQMSSLKCVSNLSRLCHCFNLVARDILYWRECFPSRRLQYPQDAKVR